MENTPRRFNLVEEAWIPVVDVGQVSLRQIFTDQGLRALGGNPIQKISIMKLLLAIGQAACTPKDDEEWKAHDNFAVRGKKLEEISCKELEEMGYKLKE